MGIDIGNKIWGDKYKKQYMNIYIYIYIMDTSADPELPLCENVSKSEQRRMKSRGELRAGVSGPAGGWTGPRVRMYVCCRRACVGRARHARSS